MKVLGLNGHMKNKYIQNTVGLFLACSSFLFISCDSDSKDPVSVNPQFVPQDITGYKIQFITDTTKNISVSSTPTAASQVNGTMSLVTKSDPSYSFGATTATVIGGNLISASGTGSTAILQQLADSLVADDQADTDFVGLGSVQNYTYSNGALTFQSSSSSEPTTTFSMNFESATEGSFTSVITPNSLSETEDGTTQTAEVQLNGRFVILSTN